MTERTVLITGTSSGIGAACTARLARAGWRVYAGVRRDEDGGRLTGEHGDGVVPVMLDVTDRQAIDRTMARIDDEVGRLDGVVNNAGISVSGPVELLDDDDWRTQFDVNFFAVVAVTRAALPLVDRAGGRFVHIGSIAGRTANAGMGPYSASKHALEAFNWALRDELTNLGPMRSSLVEPGEIRTAIWDKASVELPEIEERMTRAGLTDRYEWLADWGYGFLDEARRQGIDPDRVARAVEHALTADRPKARYLVGTDARIAAAVAHLPDPLRERLVGALNRSLRTRGRELRRQARSAAGTTVGA